MLQALRMLADDDATRVIVLVSKPPDPAVLATVIEAAGAAVARGTPVVGAFIGLADGALAGSGLVQAPTLAAAADIAVDIAGGRAEPEVRPAAGPRSPGGGPIAVAEPTGERRFLRGAFTGGTFCYEALSLLAARGIACASNLAGDDTDPRTLHHLLVDFGDDEFTIGRPHPMIDPTLRDRWLAGVIAEPITGVVLFDVVLGHGSHPEPINGLVEILSGSPAGITRPPLIAHVCGTDLDSPGRHDIADRLRAAGVLVADSNDEAVRWAADVLADLVVAPPGAPE
jgi:hypothetical protein